VLRFHPNVIRSIPLIIAGAVLACGGESLSAPTTGSLQVTSATSGTDLDPDGYTVTIDGTDRGALGVSGTLTVEQLAPGDHPVGLSGVAGNCQVQGDNPRTSSIAAGATATAAFTVTCTALPVNTGTLQITTATSGSNPDPDGYTVAVDGGTTQPIGSSATVTVSGIAAGPHTVTLAGFAANCGVGGANPITITVTAGQTASADFAITCTAGSVARIAFISDNPGVRDVFTVNPDGTGRRRLTDGLAGLSETPQWSPDRSQIVFEGGPNGGEIYVINADGTGLRNLTNTPTGIGPGRESETGPKWSPDGNTIAFMKTTSLEPDGDEAETDVYTIRSDGTQLTQLTATGQEAPGGGLSWSPDGTRIAFTSERGTSSQVFAMGSDGGGQTGITSAGSSFGPQWSPDGNRIAFLNQLAASPEVWTINPDGSNPTQLTNEPGDHKADVRWSPDGRKIAYTFAYTPSGAQLGSDIWTMNADGSGKLNVTSSRSDNTSPVWSPDGSQIAFVFNFGTGANAEIRVVNADGTGPQTNVSMRQGYRPDWSR
jgi:Tol biopolymer transport system component